MFSNVKERKIELISQKNNQNKIHGNLSFFLSAIPFDA